MLYILIRPFYPIMISIKSLRPKRKR
jgi:hypothetical protein